MNEQALKNMAKFRYPYSGPDACAKEGNPDPVHPGHTQSATQLVGSGSWYHNSFPFLDETPDNLPLTFFRNPQYPKPFSGISHSFAQSVQRTPEGSFGIVIGRPNAMRLLW